MMEGFEKNEGSNESDSRFREEIYSKAIRAGKRTYFFDVKTTRSNEYYLTITESKKRFDGEGKYHFEKHKIFLYKEDFEKFIESVTDIIDYIRVNQPPAEETPEAESSVEAAEKEEVTEAKDYSDVEFEDLSK